jgi:type II secretory pathway component PulF
MMQRKARKLARTVRPGSRQAKRAFSWDLRKKLYMQLMVQVANDVSLMDSLERFEVRVVRRRPDTAAIVRAIRTSMAGGHSFARAIAPWVPGQEAAVIAGGVEGQNLPRALREVLEVGTIRGEVMRTLRSELSAPLGMIFVGLAMMVAVTKFIIPQFGAALPRASATGSVAVLYAIGDFMSGWQAAVLAALIAGAAIAMFLSLPKWTGRWRLLAERFMPWSVYRDVNGYLWITGFVAMLSAGIKDTEVLRLQLQYATPYLAERLRAFKRDMESGASMPEALSEPRFESGGAFEFPSGELVEIIEAIHGGADFPERMAEVLKQWREEMNDNIKSAAKRLGRVGDVLSFGTMALVVFAVIGIGGQMMTHLGSGL